MQYFPFGYFDWLRFCLLNVSTPLSAARSTALHLFWLSTAVRRRISAGSLSLLSLFSRGGGGGGGVHATGGLLLMRWSSAAAVCCVVWCTVYCTSSSICVPAHQHAAAAPAAQQQVRTLSKMVSRFRATISKQKSANTDCTGSSFVLR